MKDRVLMFVNEDKFLYSHRLEIALQLLNEGYEVHLLSSTSEIKKKLESLGIIVHNINLDRKSWSIFKNLILFARVYFFIKRFKPRILHLISIKPVLIGGIAARLAMIDSVIYSISGLGHVYIDDSRFSHIKQYIINLLYSVSLKIKNSIIIFQNNEDKNFFIKKFRIPENRIALIRGSGVNLQLFKPSVPKEDNKVVKILMISRLLREKGVFEYVEALECLNKKNINAEFILAGLPDSGNPSAITQKELCLIKSIDNLNYLGYVDNVPKLLQDVDVMVLPSYREGFSKVLIEASAAGLPIVTTNVPGCRDAIIENKTGILVEPRNSKKLAGAIATLINDKALRKKMGLHARLIAEKHYDVHDVVNKHIDIYRTLITN